MRDGERDGAFLVWARDWLTDEHVVLMSAAARGVYWHLLCHAWLEGSVPACSEHLARIARVDHAEFQRVWPEFCSRWVPHASSIDRLVNPRQERERQKADERRKARSDKAKRAAEARWGNRTPTSTAHARRNARSNAPSMRVAVLGDALQSNPSTVPPFPPSQGGGGQPAAEPRNQNPEPATEQKPASRDRSADEDQAASTHYGGATDTEAAPSIRDEAVQLEQALLRTNYRNRVPGLKRRFVVAAEAKALVLTGMRAEHVPDLLRLAERGDDPGALLAHWLDRNEWRSVLDEDAMKRRQAGLMAARPGPDESLRGIYGDDPMPARDLVGSVLQRAGA